uniref:Uncharacterized protein n=1 Tax=Octopus bimaculoides TaxID=37653 RepID=A0A0L8HT97_OCTBM
MELTSDEVSIYFFLEAVQKPSPFFEKQNYFFLPCSFCDFSGKEALSLVIYLSHVFSFLEAAMCSAILSGLQC